MITGGLIKLISWIFMGLLIPFPTSLPLLSYDSWLGLLAEYKPSIIVWFGFIGKIFPIEFFTIFLIIVFWCEFTMLAFRLGIMILNIFRGSGA